MSRKSLETLRKIVSSNFTKLRSKLGWSLEAVAEKLDVEAATVSRWEAGAIWPPPERFEAIAKFYSVPVHTLFQATSQANLGIPEAITGLLLALETVVQELRVEELEVRSKRETLSAEDYLDHLESLDEVKGRIGFFASVVSDAANHFLYIRGDLIGRPNRPATAIFKMYLEKLIDAPVDFSLIYKGDRNKSDYVTALNQKIEALEKAYEEVSERRRSDRDNLPKVLEMLRKSDDATFIGLLENLERAEKNPESSRIFQLIPRLDDAQMTTVLNYIESLLLSSESHEKYVEKVLADTSPASPKASRKSR
jgi:transcriptional regulator with XRE-family HTH domain